MSKKILIFHTAFIGDIVLSTAMVKKIKANNINSKITYVTTPTGKAILANNPHIDEIIAYEKRGKDKGIKGMLNLSKRLKKEKFDIAYIPHRYLRSSLVVYLAGIKERIGYSNSEGKFLLTEKISYDKSKHEVEKLLSLVKGQDLVDNSLELFPSEEDRNYIEDIWKRNKLEEKKVVAVAIGSKWNTKRWPIEYFNSLIEKLEEIEDVRVVIIGGKDELELSLKYTEKSINMINKTSLLQLAQLLKKSYMVITNDSSPIHIGSAFDTFVFAIFGATVKELGFTPWTSNSLVVENEGLYCRPCGLHGGNECPEGHFRCMMELTPELVFERVLEVLEKR